MLDLDWTKVLVVFFSLEFPLMGREQSLCVWLQHLIFSIRFPSGVWRRSSGRATCAQVTRAVLCGGGRRSLSGCHYPDPLPCSLPHSPLFNYRSGRLNWCFLFRLIFKYLLLSVWFIAIHHIMVVSHTVINCNRATQSWPAPGHLLVSSTPATSPWYGEAVKGATWRQQPVRRALSDQTCCLLLPLWSSDGDLWSSEWLRLLDTGPIWLWASSSQTSFYLFAPSPHITRPPSRL